MTIWYLITLSRGVLEARSGPVLTSIRLAW